MAMETVWLSSKIQQNAAFNRENYDLEVTICYATQTLNVILKDKVYGGNNDRYFVVKWDERTLKVISIFTPVTISDISRKFLMGEARRVRLEIYFEFEIIEEVKNYDIY